MVCMRGSRRFCQWGSKFENFFLFLVDWGIEDPNTAINGPSSTRQQNAIEMGFCWRADGGPTLNAGLVACGFTGDPAQYYLEIVYFCNFSRGGGRAPCTSILIPAWFVNLQLFPC